MRYKLKNSEPKLVQYYTHHESLIKVAALPRGLVIHRVDVTSTVIVLSLSSGIPSRRRYRCRLVSIHSSSGLLGYGSCIPERIPRLVAPSLLYATDEAAGLSGFIASRFVLSGRRCRCRSEDSAGRDLLTTRRLPSLVSCRVLSRVGRLVARRGHGGFIASRRQVLPPRDSSIDSSGRYLFPACYGSRMELVTRDVVVDTFDLVGSGKVALHVTMDIRCEMCLWVQELF